MPPISVVRMKIQISATTTAVVVAGPTPWVPPVVRTLDGKV